MVAARVLLGLLLVFPALSSPEKDWDRIKAKADVIWGEGWGSSVEEADREALAALSSRISVAVTSDFRSVEGQLSTSHGTEYLSRRSSTLRVASTATLANTGRIVLKTGRRAHVGRWIHRSELDALILSREQRVLEYEDAAQEAEEERWIGDALRFHYWAYVLLRSLPKPSVLRDADGRMLLVAVPESMNRILDGISVRTTKEGNRLRLSFRYDGCPVRNLSFVCFTGAGWSPRTEVSAGVATVELAPGALGEIVQLKVEYKYEADAEMDPELSELLKVTEIRPLGKAQIIFRR